MNKIIAMITSLLLCLTTWGMKPVSDADLATVAGQAGISINPDITMDITIGTMAWGDADGINPSCGVNPWPTEGMSGGGCVGVNDFEIPNLRIRLRDSDTFNGYNSLMLRPVTIDVATGYKAFSGHGDNTTFVRISPGALRISMDRMQFCIAMGAHGSPGLSKGVALDETLGVATVAPMDLYFNPRSSVDIYSHNGRGVAFDVNTTIDAVKLPYLSWGSTR